MRCRSPAARDRRAFDCVSAVAGHPSCERWRFYDACFDCDRSRSSPSVRLSSSACSRLRPMPRSPWTSGASGRWRRTSCSGSLGSPPSRRCPSCTATRRCTGTGSSIASSCPRGPSWTSCALMAGRRTRPPRSPTRVRECSLHPGPVRRVAQVRWKATPAERARLRRASAAWNAAGSSSHHRGDGQRSCAATARPARPRWAPGSPPRAVVLNNFPHWDDVSPSAGRYDVEATTATTHVRR